MKIPVEVTNDSGLSILRRACSGEYPAEFVFAGDPSSLQMLVDGLEVPIYLNLKPTGFWSITAEVEV